MACKESTGKNPDRADIAPPTPTALIKARRRSSSGKRALTKLASIKSLLIF